MSGPAGFGLTLPDDWFELPLDNRSRNGAIADLVDERIERKPDLAAHRQALIQLLRAAARDASEAGAVFCAMWADEWDHGPVAASATLVLTQTPAGGATAGGAGPAGGLAATAAQLEVALREADPAAEIRVVTLPAAGDAVRAASATSANLGEGRVMPVVGVQYYVPWPAGGVAVLNLTTPTMAVATELVRLFDAIAMTLELRTAGEE